MRVLSERRKRAIADFEKYGNFQKGEYRGYKWHAQRCLYDGSPPSSPRDIDIATATIYHWGGYVMIEHFDPKKVEKYEDCMARGGDSGEPTYNKVLGDALILGFDCGHFWDVEVYREFPYVLEIIHRTIDNLCEEV